ncbi:MAG: type I restriction-modification system subunit M [Betaproteobacteria bacterium]|nr:type I restriction-modification system subunit M [Betaproteobacteria bacterium]
MLTERHKEIAGKIWEIANRLRGPYRPPQYRLVMLPMVVLRRLDCVLEPTKDAVLAEHARLSAAKTPPTAIPRLLTGVVDKERQQPLYNVSPYTFHKLLGDSENIAPNLVAYINGFSATARRIFDKFKFSDQIEKLDASNRLFAIVKAMSEVDLHPKKISNIEMGYIFEHLVMRFNEQANEEAGDHFTPREVIRLMTHLVYTGEEDVYKPGVYREIYDPACGTGGMLSVSEETIRAGNASANLGLYGQEYNDESWAICCSDMLIKDEETDQIILGDTLGDGKTRDGFPEKQFHYMLANPPFGVEWKDQQKVVAKEAEELGFHGRFGAGLPAINDGSLLFLQHMIAKMKPAPDKGGEGSRIAIIFNGSPLFSGDAGSGPSNIRRWIIENDWLDAIVALPDQLFYNTGIFTYIWLVTNRKPAERRGKVQLIDGTRFFQKMKKSLNNKRNELSDAHIDRLTGIYGNFRDGERETVLIDGQPEQRVVSRIFANHAFGFLKITVERPLRLNFAATPERIARLDEQSAFINLAVSKKRKDAQAAEAEEAAGRAEQQAIRDLLATLAPKAPLAPDVDKGSARALEAPRPLAGEGLGRGCAAHPGAMDEINRRFPLSPGPSPASGRGEKGAFATTSARGGGDYSAAPAGEPMVVEDAARGALYNVDRATIRFPAEGKLEGRYLDRAAFEADLDAAAKKAGQKLPAPIKKAIFAALGERDPQAEICRDAKGAPEPDSELRDTENIPLPAGTTLPLPMNFGPEMPNDALVAAMRGTIDAYMAAEVLPHVPDAWVDYSKTKVGYEIPINRHFYVYKPPRPLGEIEADIQVLEGEIAGLLKGLVA